MADTKYCECPKPFIADTRGKGVPPRPYPMENRWPECRACGRMVRRQLAEWVEGHAITGTVQ